MKLNDIRIAHKLWGTLGAVVLCLGAAAAGSDFSIERTVEATESEVAHYNELTQLATRWVGLTETNLQRSLAELVSADPAIETTFVAARKKASAEITDLQKRISDAATLDSDRAALDAVAAARAKVLALREEGFGLRKAGKTDSLATLINTSYVPATAAYVESLARFVELQAAHRDASMAQGLAQRQQARLTSAAAALLVLGLALGWVTLLVRSISQPLARAVAVADAISKGDLTQRVDDARDDEFGQLLRAQGRMASQLQSLVSDVRVGVHAVSVASSEIATGNHDLSERTERTASSLQETASSMEQLRSTVSQSVDTAQEADKLAASAAKAAERGGEVVGQVVASMQQISESSRRIADIIGVIDGIAFQTNILALNAAVEAARAGEQGRGFAVVASEVRSLASRSADAAKEIKQLIGSSVARVESGSALVDETGRVMTEIVSSVKRVNSLMAEIASAAAEQRDGISQINQAVGGLDTMTQQNAALVEESAAAASSLKEQAERLAVVVSVFDVGTSDGAQRNPTATAPIDRGHGAATGTGYSEVERQAA